MSHSGEASGEAIAYLIFSKKKKKKKKAMIYYLAQKVAIMAY
jgi:hypothetical protein